MTITIEAAIRQVTADLKPFSDTAHLDAEVLIMLVTKKTREQLFAYPEKTLTKTQQQQLKEYVQRRRQGEPIAYITGHKEFWSLDLLVMPDVLIPRPETEDLVQWVLETLPKDKNLKVADLGVGSGAIAVALAHERPNWQIDATEKQAKALAIAKQNAKRHQLNNINFFQGSWCEPLPQHDYALIVSNPPYIDHNYAHLKTLTYEPKSALDGGQAGLEAIIQIIDQAKSYLAAGGYLVLEHGFDQKEKIIELLQQAGYHAIADHTDLAGLPRFISAKKK